eukprot:gene36473-53561_t
MCVGHQLIFRPSMRRLETDSAGRSDELERLGHMLGIKDVSLQYRVAFMDRQT